MTRLKSFGIAVGIAVVAGYLGTAAAIAAQQSNVTNAIVIAALQAMGLFGDGYANGQVPAWSTTLNMYTPSSVLSPVNPVFTGQMTGPVGCAPVTYSFTGRTTTGLCSSAAGTWDLVGGGTTSLQGTSTVVRALVPIQAPIGTAGAPSIYGAGVTTTGWAWTATPSLIASISGSAILTIGATSVTAANAASIGWTDAIWQREGANWTFQRNGASAQRVSWANTYTSATNYESFSADWQTVTNVALVGTRTAATGTGRALRLIAQTDSGADSYSTLQLQGAALGVPFLRAGLLSSTLTTISSAATGNWMEFGGGTSTATSGTIARFAILSIYNQAAATTSNTDLLINRTQTAIGSGTQRLIDAQVGGTSQFNVSNTGNVTALDGIFSGNGATGRPYMASGAVQMGWFGRTIMVGNTDGVWQFSNNGTTFGVQLNAGTSAPTVSSCGTGTITDAGGTAGGARNTVGMVTATGATACTITFGGPAWTNTPGCTLTLQNAPTTTPYVSARSTTAITVSGLTAGDVFVYHCIGRT
jgi:hypothetical protein